MTRARDTANIVDLPDAKGDLYASTAADAPVRVALGTTGQFLQADTVQTSGMKWASGPIAGTATTGATGVGYMGLPQNASGGTTGTYFSGLADAGGHIYSTASRQVTISSNAAVPYPVGTAITIINGTGATATIVCSDTMWLAGAGTTGNRTLAPFGMATAVKLASTTWIISGSGLT